MDFLRAHTNIARGKMNGDERFTANGPEPIESAGARLQPIARMGMGDADTAFSRARTAGRFVVGSAAPQIACAME